jgi:hypothetical protein
MRDRWALVSFLGGLAAFCAVGLLAGHLLAAVGALVASVVAVAVTMLAVRAFRHQRLVRALRAVSVPGELTGTAVRTGEPHVAGFTPAIDLRLRALLGENPDVRTPPVVRRSAMLVAGGALGAASCTWFLHQHLTAFGLPCC